MRNSIAICTASLLAVVSISLVACGGGSSNSSSAMTSPPPPPPPPPPALDPQYRASAASPFPAGCEGMQAGTLYLNAEVEPFLTINPVDARNFAGVWQQDRWSNGGARGIVAGASFDGGATWRRTALPFTRCSGGMAANGGDYERTSNPWISFAADGTAHVIALAFDGQVLEPGSTSAVVASRSVDGGATWSAASTLILDGADAFNDKGAVTADPLDARFVYTVWDRLSSDGRGPSYLARSIDGGVNWEPARAIYDPGLNNQTIGNVLVVLPNGILVVLFTELDATSATTFTAFLGVIRSMDNGVSWSTPIHVADLLAVGTRDPDTGAPVRDSALLGEIAVGSSGSLDVVWQDSRFSGGARDSIALSRSTDGGLGWSAPVRVNPNAGIAAFSPMVTVRADGLIGVTYYDFRSNTTDRTTLPTDDWLARSSDGATWQETRVAAPFDLAQAPVTSTPVPGGYFLGDYQGLVSSGGVFVPLFTQTNAGDLDNRTDVFLAPAVSIGVGAADIDAKSAADVYAAGRETTEMTPELAARVHENIVNAMESRIPGWSALRARRSPEPR